MSHTTATYDIDAGPSRSRRRFLAHFGEMLLAMFAGMVVLGGLAGLLFAVAGSSFSDASGAVQVLVMGFNMTVPMVAWMRYRGHGWWPCAEMGAAMYLPFLVLFPPMWAGWIDSGGMLLWGHVLMLFAMAGAMALRPSEYAHC